MNDRKDSTATTPASDSPPGFFGAVGGIVRAIITGDDDEPAQPQAKRSKKPGPMLACPPALVAVERVTVGVDEDVIEFRDVVIPAVALSAQGVSTKSRVYSPELRCAVVEPFIWTAVLEAAAVHYKLEPVVGEILTRSHAPMMAELVALRDFWKESVAPAPNEVRDAFAKFMLVIAVQKWRRTAQDAASAVQNAWTSPWQHSSFRGRVGSYFEGTSPTPQRPLDPKMLARLAAEVTGAPKWMYQGEGVAEIAGQIATADAAAKAKALAATVAEAARNRLVRIVPQSEGMIVLHTPLVESGRGLYLCPWPLPVANVRVLTTVTGIARPLPSTIADPNVAIDVPQHELDIARRTLPWNSVFEALVAHMRALPGAADPIAESDTVTQKSGIFVSRSRISTFRKLVELALPALELDDRDRVAFFHGALLQAGTRGLLLHPLSVATEISRAAKRMSPASRAWASETLSVARDAFGALRGGSGAWCPPGYLLEKKDSP